MVAACSPRPVPFLLGGTCRKLGLAEATLYAWKKGYRGLSKCW